MTFLRIHALMAATIATAALLAACGGDDDGERRATPTEVTGLGDDDGVVEIELTAANVEFDKDTLEVPAGAEVSLTLDNRDTVEHSFSLYETAESDEALFEGPRFEGPSFLIYEFSAPDAPGTYQFRCGVHPAVMTGDFVVE